MDMHTAIDFRDFARGAGTVMHYRQDDVIFREHDPSHCMYIVLTGSVEIASHDKVIEVIHAGQALGIVSLLDKEPRATTARAREETELAVLDRRRFRYMVEEVPNFVWYVMDELTHRLRMVTAAL
jgi:CRP-like cAMP-binding protein